MKFLLNLIEPVQDVRKIYQGEKGRLIIGYTGILSKLLLLIRRIVLDIQK